MGNLADLLAVGIGVICAIFCGAATFYVSNRVRSSTEL